MHLAVFREASANRRPGEGSVIAALVQARADPNIKTRNQVAPVHTVLGPLPQPAQRRSAALRALLDCRANVEATCRTGERPLHLAVAANLRVEAALLLEHRACPDAAREDGNTPLHCAAQHGAGVCVELLLNARADMLQCNASGQSASDVARQCGLEPAERLIRRHSAAPPGEAGTANPS